MKLCKSVSVVSMAVIAVLSGDAFLTRAQSNPGVAPPTYSAPQDSQSQYEPLDGSDMEQLVSRVALYPDPLLAQVFPAATYPLEIQAAATFLHANPNPTSEAIDSQAVEPPVKALLHYPAVLNQMAGDLDWTTELGLAFINQQPDVMNAVQRLRVRAQTAGTLASGPQQQVTQDDDGISIVPTDDNTLYVPQYDANSLYVGDGSAYLTYGQGYPAGAWLNYDFGWRDHRFGYGGGWDHGWSRNRDHRPPDLRPWERNRAQPIPLRHPDPGGATWHHYGPSYDDHNPVRAPGAFDYGRGSDVHRADEQARHEQPALRSQPRENPAPRQQSPAPRQEVPFRQSSPSAFHPDSGRSAAAQSNRGHASFGGGGHAGGGGGGRR